MERKRSQDGRSSRYNYIHLLVFTSISSSWRYRGVVVEIVNFARTASIAESTWSERHKGSTGRVIQRCRRRADRQSKLDFVHPSDDGCSAAGTSDGEFERTGGRREHDGIKVIVSLSGRESESVV